MLLPHWSALELENCPLIDVQLLIWEMNIRLSWCALNEFVQLISELLIHKAIWRQNLLHKWRFSHSWTNYDEFDAMFQEVTVVLNKKNLKPIISKMSYCNSQPSIVWRQSHHVSKRCKMGTLARLLVLPRKKHSQWCRLFLAHRLHSNQRGIDEANLHGIENGTPQMVNEKS